MGPASAIDDWLAANGDVPGERTSASGWDLVLAGERKRTIPVHLELGAHTLTIQSFFVRAPDENAEAFYAYLLRRNLRTYTLRFAVHPDGDVLLVGVLPLPAVTVGELDRTMGQLLIAADEAFDHALRTGFGSYIEREQAWRAKVGLGRNPIS
jgi:hypothetical protein